MTAPIVTNHTRRALDQFERVERGRWFLDSDAKESDRETFPWSGQLWQREAERDAATELYARWIRHAGPEGKDTVFTRTRAGRERMKRA